MLIKPEDKICSFEEMPELINGNDGLKRQGHRVVIAQGVFDLLHLGHFQYLQHAARHGLLVVGLENDLAVGQNKGPTRPINPLRDRMLAIAALDSVGLVFGFSDAPLYSDPDSVNQYIARYRALNSSIAVPNDDPNRDSKVRQAAIAGVDIVRIPGHYPNSTTQLLQTVGFSE